MPGNPRRAGRVALAGRRARLAPAVIITETARLIGLIGPHAEQVGKHCFLVITEVRSRVRDAQAVQQRQQIVTRQRARGLARLPGLLRRPTRATGSGRARGAD